MRKAIFISLIGLALAASQSVQAQTPIYSISGGVASTAAISISTDEIAAIGETEYETNIFVLGPEKHTVKGVLLRDLYNHVQSKGHNAKISALDGYTIDVPAEDFLKYDVMLATEIDGKKLSLRDKGPAWVIYPTLSHPELIDTIYESRSVWQVKNIEFN